MSDNFFSKFDSEYFLLIIFLKYLFILLLIMISCIIMTLLEKKICRTFRAVGHLGTLHACVPNGNLVLGWKKRVIQAGLQTIPFLSYISSSVSERQLWCQQSH